MQDDKVTSKQNKIRIRQRNAGMTYRKWISVFLCVIFVCGLLAGCGNDKVQEEQNDNVSANTIPEDVVVHTIVGRSMLPFARSRTATRLRLPLKPRAEKKPMNCSRF